LFRRRDTTNAELAQAMIDRLDSLEVHLVGYEDRR
jgi:hypothetical protein